MSLKNKNVIRLTLNVEMFSCRIIFASYYYRSIDVVYVDLLQISNNLSNPNFKIKLIIIYMCSKLTIL